MDFSLGLNGKLTRPRLRCYSSMNYNEYEDFFGTPPKMPEPPNSKFNIHITKASVRSH